MEREVKERNAPRAGHTYHHFETKTDKLEMETKIYIL